MQVKKFEAKSMKDALELVKHHLGPDAIILSARDINSGFGLKGQRSVEVTAAVSETTLRKKQLAESKLNQKTKSHFQQSSARQQKQFIEKVFSNYREEQSPRRPITNRPYIDIADDQDIDNQMPAPSPATAQARIRSAAEEAFRASQAISQFDTPKRAPVPQQSHEVVALRQEIARLKGVIEQFQQVPQSFVHRHPGADEGIDFHLSFMFEKLIQSGVEKTYVVKILKMAQQQLGPEQIKKKALVSAWVAKFLLDSIQVNENPLKGRYHVFVGTTGQGKTSTLVKMASHLVIAQKKKIAVVTADIFKVGAAEQLKIYAQILNVPFVEITGAADWDVLHRHFSHVDHILVDMPGLNLRTEREYELLNNLLPPANLDRAIHYVQGVIAKDSDAVELAQRYSQVGVDDVIFTRLDESVQHGLIYNFQTRFSKPLHSFGIGSSIPEDYEFATKERVVDLIFKLTKLKKKEDRHE